MMGPLQDRSVALPHRQRFGGKRDVSGVQRNRTITKSKRADPGASVGHGTPTLKRQPTHCRQRAAKENNMHHQLKHVESQLRRQEAMMRAMMPRISASDPEPLTIFSNKPSTARKTLTFTLAEIGERDA
jgi:hypothetical protein